ncbi:MAG: flagellar biosynthetic protein FliQ [Proteobacteria bacterium]|nr:flagellar biosynthetic protein FliQ [Pseudomonadota bacterium]
MTEQTVIDIAGKAIMVAMKIAAPALISTLIVGLLVSIVQAATQINEQTLTFIPKIIILSLTLALAGPWILQTMMNFTIEIMNTIPTVTR